ncbi:uncharacterized protein LOC131857597 [Cryptomeria japonica]|uniref:uncharacterized protein LOC131857597 n=1 Tax=Cryptomeria japonica TaxID=3369 RepID=UPI0027DA48E5|nr:uncharacterized protein LOC131857597 [Cryptomeria japonica]
MAEPKIGPRRRFPFRFEKMWLSHPNLSSSVKDWWNVQVDGSAMFQVSKKLRHVKEEVKKWNREVFGDIFVQKFAIQEELGLIQDKDQNEGYVNDNFSKESEVFSKYHKIIAQEETFWRKRSRSLWLKDGDKNLRFFHISTLKHMAANRIGHLVKNGRRIDNEDEISGVVVEFFAELLKKDTLLDLEAQNMLVDIIPKVLSDNQNHNIDVIPSKEEIRSVVFSFDGSKAPGPYGFPMFFFQHFWEVVGEDVSNVVKEFFGARSIQKELNATFIFLIPKKQGIDSLDAFRPIILCNSFYKIISKVLTSRMLNILPLLISPQQNGFAPGSQILDSIILFMKTFIHFWR